MADQLFYIASLKHTAEHHEHITWWGPNYCGYTPVVGATIGTYSREQARGLNDGLDYIAVPVEAVRALLSPEPYYRPRKPARFYDLKGPVVDNTRENWHRLVAKSLAEGRVQAPQPVPFKGNFRSFALPGAQVAHG